MSLRSSLVTKLFFVLGSKVPSMHSRLCPQSSKYRGADVGRLIGLWLGNIKYYAHVQALCAVSFSSEQSV